jgi:hypothetical protein
VNAVNELTRDRERRLLNQRAFPLSFIDCSCERGCLVCAYTGLVSRAEGKQIGHRDPAPPRPGGRPGSTPAGMASAPNTPREV